ncbi:MAG: GAF domain-containing protein [Oscillochloris sp.]|nr:GAF domain-containing protein [Oscillochloris sp.]
MSETFYARAEPWLRANIRDTIRAILPLPVLALAWWFDRVPLAAAATLGLVIYALINLGLLILLHQTPHRRRPHQTLALLITSALSDAILAVWMLTNAGPLTLGIFPIYVVLAMKALRYRRQFVWIVLVPAFLGPLFLSALFLQAPATPTLTTEQTIAYWGLVGSSAFFVGLLLIMAEHRLREIRRLQQQIEQISEGRNERVAELESTNNDLRVRIRRQQALEESLRAITGSLSLDDVLGQILDSMLQMLGTPRVGVAALTLVNESGFTHRTLGTSSNHDGGWLQLLAQEVVRTQVPVMVGDALHERQWRELQSYGVLSALSVPLVDVNHVVRGALTVVSSQRHAFTPTEERHLTSFSIQAAVAIHNAELHSALSQQQAMLQAVLRDIDDGLVVLDEQSTIVLTNPVAMKAFEQSAGAEADLAGYLEAIATQARETPADAADDRASITEDVTIGAEGSERFYRVYASPVRVDGKSGNHIALVLHDITGQKLQERQRVEFISMVAHELRNPLNTLTGFLKVVLQGKVGPLNEMQTEFLGLADEQAGALKGRISELLEFNRLESGRLRLQPQWNDLTDLIVMTCTRLQIQAEQFSLALTHDIERHIPELLMDSERITQVITNLVENAMKATPEGGSIAVTTELRNTEVLVHVSDTGVGIPADQLSKIFGRFYRLENKSSKHGVHLGLGLSICQQIIEGHNGRIWVESAEGQGSRFSFALPLTPRPHLISEPIS